MGGSEPKSDPTLGFLTVVGSPSQGLLGGLLVLNSYGRPLEFHCTAPVRPTRAQEILYGPTLAPYLYGEQIGGALAAKAKSKVALLLTDQPETLALRPLVETPLVLVFPSDAATAAVPEGKQWRVDGAESPAPHAETLRKLRNVERFAVGRQELAVDAAHRGDQAAIVELLTGRLLELDLTEPFERITEALAEAQSAK